MKNNWRDSIKLAPPKIRVAPHWKNTIRPEPPKVIHGRDGVNGKDGRHGVDGKNGRDGINGKNGTNGKDGKNGSSFYFASSLSDDFGSDNDTAILDKTLDVFVKINGEWKFKGSLKQREKTLVTGGVSESFVTNAINAALANGGGSTSQIVRETATDYTLTNENVLLCMGTNPINVTVNNSATYSVLVRNFTNQQVTVLGGTFYIGKDDAGVDITDTSWVIPRGNAFNFVLKDGNFYAY